MGKILIILAFFIVVISAQARDDGDILANILAVEGVNSIEELTQDIVDSYIDLTRNKVAVNLSQRELLRSGLFSTYQIASIMDYIHRNGQIYSLEEFAIIDGIGKDFACALEPFLSFDFTSETNNRALMKNDLYAGGSIKNFMDYNYRLKYNMTYGSRWEFNIGLKSMGEDPPRHSACSFVYRGRRWLRSIVLGDYNLTWGQGLAMWTGFSLSGIGTKMVKTKSTLSPYRSYYSEDAHRGLAAEFAFGRWELGTFISLVGSRELMMGEDVRTGWAYGSNLKYMGRLGHVGIQAYGRYSGVMVGHDDVKLSADGRLGYKGVDFFTELAWDFLAKTGAAIAGVRHGFTSAWSSSISSRYYPSNFSSAYSGGLRTGSKTSNEYGLAWANDFSSGTWVGLKGKSGLGSSVIKHKGSASLDLVYMPSPKAENEQMGYSNYLKAVSTYSGQVSPSFNIAIKLSERYRSYAPMHRAELRLKGIYSNGKFSFVSQGHVLYSEDLSYLLYLEGGCDLGSFSAHLRAGGFFVDNWNDRIYVYERDAPGSFNVPAYYGRGGWTALAGAWELANWAKIYFRASYIKYFAYGNIQAKPDKVELSIQFRFRF